MAFLDRNAVKRLFGTLAKSQILGIDDPGLKFTFENEVDIEISKSVITPNQKVDGALGIKEHFILEADQIRINFILTDYTDLSKLFNTKEEQFSKLEKMLESGGDFQLILGMKKYDNVNIQTLKINEGNSEAITGDITLEEIRKSKIKLSTEAGPATSVNDILSAKTSKINLV